jgi:hypothetical protein
MLNLESESDSGAGPDEEPKKESKRHDQLALIQISIGSDSENPIQQVRDTAFAAILHYRFSAESRKTCSRWQVLGISRSPGVGGRDEGNENGRNKNERHDQMSDSQT